MRSGFIRLLGIWGIADSVHETRMKEDKPSKN